MELNEDEMEVANEEESRREQCRKKARTVQEA